jgi:hypothetical protein
MMKSVPVEEAVGMVLCHDVTRIVPKRCKGPAFRKGHVIRPEDVSAMRDLGKAHVYVLDLEDGYVHENDAARRIAGAAAGPGLRLTGAKEGRVDLQATDRGLLEVSVDGLRRINAVGDVVFATLHTGQVVQAGQAVGGTRIVPLVTDEARVLRVEKLCRERFPIVQVRGLRVATVGLVTTGSEVYHGRIQDGFGPVVRSKFEELGSRILRQIFVSDDRQLTARAIGTLIDEGADFIAVTGGMSVDPDDQTPAGIRAAGARVVSYGAPVFPGAMFMLAYIGEVPVVGLPGCVMYYHASIFDLVVPRLLAGVRLVEADISALGHGGFCAGCPDCRYPLCGFGKGGH